MEQQTTPTFKIGNATLTTPTNSPKPLLIMLWGKSGAGKTTLAATAPGKKLWLAFDPGVASALCNAEDIQMFDLSMEGIGVVLQASASADNPLGLKSILEKLTDIDTIVVDSLTTFSDKALALAVTETKSATPENPTMAGYGRRKSYVARFMYALINLCSRMNKNLVFIAHEDAPDKDELTGTITVSILIGGSLKSEVPIRLSEVWHLQDTGKERKISVRPIYMRSDMKTRMFNCGDRQSFTWQYDIQDKKGEGIATWYNKWKENNYELIPLPK